VSIGKNRTRQLDIYYSFIDILYTPEVAALMYIKTLDTRQEGGG
jgi:hypothetical protein